VLAGGARITFERRGVREMAAAKEARDPGAVLTSGVGAAAIGQTLVPNSIAPDRFGDQSDYARAQARPPDGAPAGPVPGLAGGCRAGMDVCAGVVQLILDMLHKLAVP
jgi:hypothetical protein